MVIPGIVSTGVSPSSFLTVFAPQSYIPNSCHVICAQPSQDSTSGDMGLSKCVENPSETIASPCFYELVGFSFCCPISDPCVLAEPDLQDAGLEGQSVGLLPAVVSSCADHILVVV